LTHAHATRGGRRFRIAHLITDAGPHPYFRLIGAHADRERFDVRIGTVGPAGALQAEAREMDLRSFALGARGRASYATATLRLARMLRGERIDVLHTHLLDASLVGGLAGRLARTPAIVFTGHHSHEMPLHDHRLLTAVDRLCAGPLCDAIIAPSAQMRDTLVRLHGVRPEKVTVIHHGFELAQLDPSVVDGAQVRRELDLEGRTVLTAIGRYYWIKNQEALVRAFASATASMPEVVLVLVGGGDGRPLRELAGSLGIVDRVRVLGPTPDVPGLLAATDLFVHPALAESFGMVIVEAMGMARPVVATPVGIVPEVLEDGATGFLAADGSVDALSAALDRALSARKQWLAMGAEGRRRAGSFDAAGMLEAYERLYDGLARASRRAAA
jgi:glycosyltransferase involved in cell wall biosynthesis